MRFLILMISVLFSTMVIAQQTDSTKAKADSISVDSVTADTPLVSINDIAGLNETTKEVLTISDMERGKYQVILDKINAIIEEAKKRYYSNKPKK